MRTHWKTVYIQHKHIHIPLSNFWAIDFLVFEQDFWVLNNNAASRSFFFCSRSFRRFSFSLSAAFFSSSFRSRCAMFSMLVKTLPKGLIPIACTLLGAVGVTSRWLKLLALWRGIEHWLCMEDCVILISGSRVGVSSAENAESEVHARFGEEKSDGKSLTNESMVQQWTWSCSIGLDEGKLRLVDAGRCHAGLYIGM